MSQLEDEDYARVMEVIRHAVEADEQGDTAFATQIMTAVVEEFPGLAIGHGYLGWILSRSGRYREAIAHGQVGIQLSPASERVSLLFFRVLWGADQREQALDEMRRFVTLEDSEEYAQIILQLEQAGI